MNSILVTNIQRFSLHDGPGIRTTIFLKGCALHCPWCCNPENISPSVQNYLEDGICGTYGSWYTTEQLYQEVIKDKIFYNSAVGFHSSSVDEQPNKLAGGVTFSGGEALLQICRMEELLQMLKQNHIHTVIETSLFAPQKCVNIALTYIDLFYVDIKILDVHSCRQLLGGDLNQYFDNLNLVLRSGKPIVFRIPVISGFTDDPKNRKRIVDLLKKANGNIIKIELLKEHSLGLKKYQSLVLGGNDIQVPEYHGIGNHDLIDYQHYIQEETAFPVEICEI